MSVLRGSIQDDFEVCDSVKDTVDASNGRNVKSARDLDSDLDKRR